MAQELWEAEKARLSALFSHAQVPSVDAGEALTISGPIHVSNHARLYLCEPAQSAAKLLAKFVISEESGAPDVEAAREQYEALIELNRASGSTRGFNLVQPFHLFADEAIVVQSWLEGQSFDKALGDKRLGVEALIAIARGAGVWIAHYHRFGSDGTTAPVRTGLLDEIEEQARTLGGRARVLADSCRGLRTSRLFDGQIRQPTALLHCDYKPANLIAANDGVYAIDFQLSKRASIYFDLAHFLNSLAIDVVKAKRYAVLMNGGRLADAFLDGYAEIAGPIDRLVLAYYEIYDLSRYMLQYGDGEAPGIAGRLKWWALTRLLAARLKAFRREETRRGLEAGTAA